MQSQYQFLCAKKSPHNKFEVHNKNPENAQLIDPHEMNWPIQQFGPKHSSHREF